jgi:glutamine amidotransferase
MMRIAIIDYGAGNVRSVQRAFQHVVGPEVTVEITPDRRKISEAHAVVFPGQGAAGQCMGNLNSTGLAEVVREQISSGKPFMGVCVGMQLLFAYLEEHDTIGLGVLPGEVRRFPVTSGLKIPQIGWNRVKQVGEPSLLWEGIPDNSYFYFVHSYYCDPAAEAKDKVIGLTDYGPDFTSAIAHDNWFATQFHPEKSGTIGLKVYDNFVRFASRC